MLTSPWLQVLSRSADSPRASARRKKNERPYCVAKRREVKSLYGRKTDSGTGRPRVFDKIVEVCERSRIFVAARLAAPLSPFHPLTLSPFHPFTLSPFDH